MCEDFCSPKLKTIAAQMAISGWRGAIPLPSLISLLLSHAYFARHFQIFQLQSQIATFSFCTHRQTSTERYIHTYVCVVYVYAYCIQLLKRFAYFINRKCSLRATHKNNCYCHCRFSLSLLQLPPPFPIPASVCSFSSNSKCSSSPGQSWSLIPGGLRCSFYLASQNIHNNNLVLIKIVPAFCYLFIWVNAIDNFTVWPKSKPSALPNQPFVDHTHTHTRTPHTRTLTHTTLSTRMHNSFISKHCIVFSHRHTNTQTHTHIHGVYAIYIYVICSALSKAHNNLINFSICLTSHRASDL